MHIQRNNVFNLSVNYVDPIVTKYNITKIPLKLLPRISRSRNLTYCTEVLIEVKPDIAITIT